MNTTAPLFRCAWGETAFLHYEVDPAALRPSVPFEIDLFEGRAFVSVVAITLRGFLAAPSFVNVRTYVRGGAITFLAGWLPNPLGALLGARAIGIPYRLARMRLDSSVAEVHARVSSGGRRFEFRAAIDPRQTYRRPEPGSLDEFLLERYTAFTQSGRKRLSFRVWHDPWRFVSIEPDILDDRLLRTTGSWPRGARLVAAQHSPGFEEVGMGRLERVRA